MSTLWSRKVDLWYLRCFFGDVVEFSLHTFLVCVDCEDDEEEEEAETVEMRLRCCVGSGVVKKGREV